MHLTAQLLDCYCHASCRRTTILLSDSRLKRVLIVSLEGQPIRICFSKENGPFVSLLFYLSRMNVFNIRNDAYEPLKKLVYKCESHNCERSMMTNCCYLLRLEYFIFERHSCRSLSSQLPFIIVTHAQCYFVAPYVV
jgi:hypothetical protein